MELVVPSFILKLSETSLEANNDLHFLEAQPQYIGNDQGKLILSFICDLLLA